MKFKGLAWKKFNSFFFFFIYNNDIYLSVMTSIYLQKCIDNKKQN